MVSHRFPQITVHSSFPGESSRLSHASDRSPDDLSLSAATHVAPLSSRTVFQSIRANTVNTGIATVNHGAPRLQLLLMTGRQ